MRASGDGPCPLVSKRQKVDMLTTQKTTGSLHPVDVKAVEVIDIGYSYPTYIQKSDSLKFGTNIFSGSLVGQEMVLLENLLSFHDIFPSIDKFILMCMYFP